MNGVIGSRGLTINLRDRLFGTTCSDFLGINVRGLITIGERPVRFIKGNMRLSVLINVTRLRLLFKRFGIRVRRVINSNSTINCLRNGSKLTRIKVNGRTKRFPLMPGTIPRHAKHERWQYFGGNLIYHLSVRRTCAIKRAIVHLKYFYRITACRISVILVLFRVVRRLHKLNLQQ